MISFSNRKIHTNVSIASHSVPMNMNAKSLLEAKALNATPSTFIGRHVTAISVVGIVILLGAMALKIVQIIAKRRLLAAEANYLKIKGEYDKHTKPYEEPIREADDTNHLWDLKEQKARLEQNHNNPVKARAIQAKIDYDRKIAYYNFVHWQPWVAKSQQKENTEKKA